MDITADKVLDSCMDTLASYKTEYDKLLSQNQALQKKLERAVVWLAVNHWDCPTGKDETNCGVKVLADREDDYKELYCIPCWNQFLESED